MRRTKAGGFLSAESTKKKALGNGANLLVFVLPNQRLLSLLQGEFVTALFNQIKGE